MDKKGGSLVWQTVIYLIILVVFFSGVLLFVNQQKNGAGVAEDFYSKQIAGMIDSATSGAVIEMDVHKITEIALKNEVSFSNIFSFDNKNKEISVKLDSGRKTVYSWLDDVNVVGDHIILAKDGKTNVLHFEIVPPKAENEIDSGVKNG